MDIVGAKNIKESSSIVAEEKKTLKLIGGQMMQIGHRLFKYNINTKELNEHIIDRNKSTVNFNGSLNKNYKVPFLPNDENSIKHTINVEDNCIYIQALNLKNAQKKIHKIESKIIGSKNK